jgi:hypothetical protein
MLVLFRSVYRATRALITKRHPKWPPLARRLVAEAGECAACGTKKRLEAHHAIPFDEAPERELDEDNAIVLCRICHFIFGHFKSWTRWNPNVRQDVANYRNGLEAAKRADNES